MTHTYSKAGQFTVKLTVTDDDGKSSSTSKTVTVAKPATNKNILKISSTYYNILDQSDGWTLIDGCYYLHYYPDGCKLPRSSQVYQKYTRVNAGDDQYPGECVDFVKVLSNTRTIPTSKWEPGPKVITSTDIEPGTVIAIFKNGVYPSTGGGHVAVFAGFTYSGGQRIGFLVFDQNWGELYGRVGKHHIYRWGSGVTDDADNYYIVNLKGITVRTTCPVDLVVTDPDGLVITKEFSEIPEAIYLEEDFNDDGSLDDYVYIPEQKIGEYLITVVPEPDADPAATYTLEVSTEDATLLLAENVPISDIPEEPYILDPTTFDTPPVTLLTIGEPQYTDPLNNIYVSSETSFNLTAEDNLGGSGVMVTFYKIYNYTYSTDWLTYEEPFNLTQFTDGLYFIDFNSIDYAGNIEPTNTIAIILDNTPPTTTLSIGEPKYTSDTIYVTPDTPFTLEATDSGSGIYSTAYRIHNATYDSSWLTYSTPFHLTSLADGIYTIEYNSTDNIGNVETTHATSVTLFSWNYVFTDSYGRGTTLKINTEHKFFQFITPDKDYGIRNATYMRVYNRAIIICHQDDELKLATVSIDTKLDFCIAYAKDIQTGKEYWLIDKVGTEN